MAEVGSMLLTYNAYRATARDADVAVWHGRPRKLLHLGIQDTQASRFIHAALLGWSCDQYGASHRLLMGEFVRGGGRLTIASSQFTAEESGEWSIFRPKFVAAYQGRVAWNAMIDLSGIRYGNGVVFANWVRSLPILRWIFGTRRDENDEAMWGVNTCSTSVAYCLRVSGLDPVLHCADWRTTPTHLVQSPALDYIGTIVGGNND